VGTVGALQEKKKEKEKKEEGGDWGIRGLRKIPNPKSQIPKKENLGEVGLDPF
jgi:hypothetical protein